MRWFERLLAGLVLGALSLALLGPAIASGSGSLASEWTEEWCIGCGVSLGAASVYDVSYGDLDGDGVPQIVTAGENLWQNQVSPFQWFQSVFTRYSKVQYGDGGSRLTGVAVGNFAGGSGLEVATVEVDPIGTSDSKGTLRLWQWGLGSLAEIVEGRAEWHDGTGMVAEDIAAMPPGPDGHQDVVTISHYNAFSGGRLWSEVSRWSWASVPAVRVASNAVPDVELHAVALGDTDGDTILNVVGAGFHLVSSPPPSHEGELSVWRLDTAGFALVAERQWPGGSATGFSFEGVTLSNVDTDVTVEISWTWPRGTSIRSPRLRASPSGSLTLQGRMGRFRFGGTDPGQSRSRIGNRRMPVGSSRP